MPLAGLRVTRALKHPLFASLGSVRTGRGNGRDGTRGEGAGDEAEAQSGGGEGEGKHGVGEGGHGDGMQHVDLALTFLLEGGMHPELNSSKSKSHFYRSAQALELYHFFSFLALSSSCVLKTHLSSACVHSACRPVHALDTQNAFNHIQTGVEKRPRYIYHVNFQQERC